MPKTTWGGGSRRKAKKPTAVHTSRVKQYQTAVSMTAQVATSQVARTEGLQHTTSLALPAVMSILTVMW